MSLRKRYNSALERYNKTKTGKAHQKLADAWNSPLPGQERMAKFVNKIGKKLRKRYK